MALVFRSVPPSHLASVMLALSCSFAALACGDDADKGSSPDTGCVGDSCACTTCAPECDGCGSEPIAEVGPSTALVMPDGRLAITTYDEVRGALVVVLQRPGSSERTVLPVSSGVSSDVGRWARIALETSGSLVVVWYDRDRNELLTARGGVSGFAAPVKIAGLAVSHLALRVDGQDNPHVAFRNEASRTIGYATRTAITPWRVTEIDGCAGEAGCGTADAQAEEDFGLGLDLALVTEAGSSALPRIAFYDARRGDLKLASKSAAGAWTTVTLDGAGGDVGRFVSLAISPTRALGVAYYDATLGALRYLGPSGTSRVIDNGVYNNNDGRARRRDVGQLCVLDYDTRGSAHIIYIDGTTPGMRHARVPGEGTAVITELAIPPGVYPAFEAIGDRLVGAYGAFVGDAAPRTTLRLFDLPSGGTP